MATIAENLQTLVDQKAAIKSALEEKGKAPTEKLGTYPDLIKELDNEEQISYVLATSDGTQRAYTQLSSKTPITLTATANDIRQQTTAITNKGFVEGTKDIPAYYCSYGYKIIPAGQEATIISHETGYKNILVTITSYNSSVDKSVSVGYSSVDDSMYEAKSTTKISNITKDLENEQIKLGITVTEKSVLRYFVVREEV